MWFRKIFVIIFYLASIWLDRGGCAPYSYFGVGDIADNSDVQQPLLISDSLKTPDRQVSEGKTTNNIPTRGLFYPDDMFFTHWVPNVFRTKNCSMEQPPVTTPSYSTLMGTLKTKQFLLNQRLPGHPGCFLGKDIKGTVKENRNVQRKLNESNRKDNYNKDRPSTSSLNFIQINSTSEDKSPESSDSSEL
ncbi:hypothetical protein QTP88_015806 [Uroleucon formosanum]